MANTTGESALDTGAVGAEIEDERRAEAVRGEPPFTEHPASGDRLAAALKDAVIAGLIAQGLAPFDAATLGAHIHGKAGDIAAADLSQQGMIATDLLAALPRAIWETI